MKQKRLALYFNFENPRDLLAWETLSKEYNKNDFVKNLLAGVNKNTKVSNVEVNNIEGKEDLIKVDDIDNDLADI